jgi:ubiquinone/menaquinone biosynthesis C-methylase UbiE
MTSPQLSSSSSEPSKLNDAVRSYWEGSPCGVSPKVVGDVQERSREWFERIEQARYETEPFVHSVAQFSRAHGKKLLEIGVGAGVDHLQWARAGANCYGVDLTDAAIELTRARLETYGLSSNLQRVDAEELPFPDNSFDMVYSWGVIHHSAHPERIVAEVHRVLKPGGKFIGMMYHRHSLKVFTAWVYWAAIRGKPWRSFRNVLWNHVESPGTKAYTVAELKRMFSSFSAFSAQPIKTPYDTRVYPSWLHRFFPDQWGWFIALRATK